MTVTDFEHKVASFFGDAGIAEKYMRLKTIEDKIKMIWTAPVIQVGLKIHKKTKKNSMIEWVR